MSKVQISLSKIGIGQVIVDGVDVSNHVSALTLDSKPGEISRLTLEVMAVDGVLVNVEADVEAKIKELLADTDV